MSLNEAAKLALNGPSLPCKFSNRGALFVLPYRSQPCIQRFMVSHARTACSFAAHSCNFALLLPWPSSAKPAGRAQIVHRTRPSASTSDADFRASRPERMQLDRAMRMVAVQKGRARSDRDARCHKRAVDDLPAAETAKSVHQPLDERILQCGQQFGHVHRKTLLS